MKILYIKADSNDADYIGQIYKISKEEEERLLRISKKLKKLSEVRLSKLESLLGKEDAEYLIDFVPDDTYSGKCHTIEDLLIFDLNEPVSLLQNYYIDKCYHDREEDED